MVKEFNAIFRGGFGENGLIKQSLVMCKVEDNGDMKYRFFGRKTFKTLLNSDWSNGIVDIEGKDEHGNLKYPYMMFELYQGGKMVPIRVYDISLKLEPYNESLLQSSLRIDNKQKGIEVMELKQINSTLMQKTNDLAYGDRYKKVVEEDSKFGKKIRSHYTYGSFDRSDI